MKHIYGITAVRKKGKLGKEDKVSDTILKLLQIYIGYYYYFDKIIMI